jgi:hypothetical protein
MLCAWGWWVCVHTKCNRGESAFTGVRAVHAHVHVALSDDNICHGSGADTEPPVGGVLK